MRYLQPNPTRRPFADVFVGRGAGRTSKLFAHARRITTVGRWIEPVHEQQGHGQGDLERQATLKLARQALGDRPELLLHPGLGRYVLKYVVNKKGGVTRVLLLISGQYGLYMDGPLY